MSVMPRTHAGFRVKPETSRGFARRMLLPGLAAGSLLSLFALPRVAAQVTAKPLAASAASRFAPPGSVPVIGIPDTGPGTLVPLPAGLKITTERFNNARNGFNNLETALTPASVVLPQPAASKTSFGKLFTRTVDGLIYGQPLYVQNLPVTNNIGQSTTHNVVFVATNNNSVYAFDADSNAGSNSGPLWHVNFNVLGLNATPTDGNDVTTVFGLPQSEIQPLIGIIGTPVIDETTGTLYVVARTTEGTNYSHRLHAIDIRTGLEKTGSPALVGQFQDPFSGNISPITVPGNGDGADGNGNIAFDLLNQNQRAALTLVNGTVYVSYGGFDNSPPYHGWVFGYNTANLLALPSAFCTTPNNVTDTSSFFPQPTGGGIGMSGVGPASDGSSLYFTTGLGALFPISGEYTQTVLKLPLSLSRSTTDPNFGLFRPSDYITLSTAALDLGTGGVALLPNGAISGRSAMITAGQEGKIYLLDRSSGTVNVISTLPNAIDQTPPLLGASYGAPSVFTDNTGQVKVFFHAVGDSVRCFNVNSTATAPPYLTFFSFGSPSGSNTPLRYDFPGAQTVVSANNGANGLLWDVESAPVPSVDPNLGNTTQDHYAVLHAYDTATLTELYNSNLKGGGINSIGNYSPFTQPLVAAGKVFVPAVSPLTGGSTVPQGRLVVFGLTNTQPATTGQGTHYQLSGPVSWSFVPFATVEVGRAYQYSLTAVDANNQPKKITGSVTIALTDGFGRKLSLGSATFNNQSYITFSKTINTQGGYFIQALDSNGNASQSGSTISVVGTAFQGYDRFTLRMPASARSGQLTNITITPVTATGFPTAYRGGVSIYDTLPDGTQDSLLVNPPLVSSFAYEFQYGGFPFEIAAGASIGITGTYPTINGTGTYPCIFNRVGQHVVIIQDDFFGTTTGIINVTP